MVVFEISFFRIELIKIFKFVFEDVRILQDFCELKSNAAAVKLRLAECEADESVDDFRDRFYMQLNKKLELRKEEILEAFLAKNLDSLSKLFGQFL